MWRITKYAGRTQIAHRPKLIPMGMRSCVESISQGGLREHGDSRTVIFVEARPEATAPPAASTPRTIEVKRTISLGCLARPPTV